MMLVATDFYLEKIKASFIQLSDVTRSKLEFVTLVFVNGPCSTWLTWQKNYITICATLCYHEFKCPI